MKYVYDPATGQVVPKTEQYVVELPGVIPDSMPGFVSDEDGKYYDSKSSLRRMYKEKGLVEKHGLGLKPWNERQYSSSADSIRDSYERVIARMKGYDR